MPCYSYSGDPNRSADEAGTQTAETQTASQDAANLPTAQPIDVQPIVDGAPAQQQTSDSQTQMPASQTDQFPAIQSPQLYNPQNPSSQQQAYQQQPGQGSPQDPSGQFQQGQPQFQQFTGQYGPQGQPIFFMGPIFTPEEGARFSKIRSLITASQIVALVSLFFGGVFASAVAIVLAAIAYTRAGKEVPSTPGPSMQSWLMIKRHARIALIMAILALVLNGMMLVVMIPAIVEMIQTGDLSSILGTGTGAATGVATGQGGSAW